MDKLLNTKLFLLDMDGTLYLGDEVKGTIHIKQNKFGV